MLTVNNLVQIALTLNLLEVTSKLKSFNSYKPYKTIGRTNQAKPYTIDSANLATISIYSSGMHAHQRLIKAKWLAIFLRFVIVSIWDEVRTGGAMP